MASATCSTSSQETVAFIARSKIPAVVAARLGDDARIVRATLFDKTPTSNWKVPWHQDVFVAVRTRADVAGFTGWTVKEGVHHARPPASILRDLLAVRIHLDDGDEAGALRVVPGSHVDDLLGDDDHRARLQAGPVVMCAGAAGSALLMRPLLLHASSEGAGAGHRRVLHLELCAKILPPPLQWHAAVRLDP